MKRALGYVLLFIAVFSVGVFLINLDLRGPESEAKPLLIAGDRRGAP